MRGERLARQALLVVLTLLWLKLAFDVLFDFGPASARAWFPTHAVVAVSGFALLLAGLNLLVLLRPADCRPSDVYPKSRKAVVVAAFLASLFSCWASETAVKFALMYFVVPALILIHVASPEGAVPRGVRAAVLLLGCLLLIPNDRCPNPQNWWWICNVGASPLTYAAPLDVSLCLTMKSGDSRVVRIVCFLAVAMYYAASVYHRWTSGY